VFNNGSQLWDSNHEANYTFSPGTWTFIPAEVAGSGTILSGLPIIPVPDTLPPTVPANVTALEISDNFVRLSWGASTDNDRLRHYEVSMNGVKWKDVSARLTSYTVNGLVAATTYMFTIRAVDNSGNVSESSAPLQVMTNPPPPQNEVVVYYKHGFNNPYIHFRPQNGNWTTGPGIKMLPSTFNGYSKMIINIGAATKLEALFNDGNLVWDNNGGLNYLFDIGTSTYLSPSVLGTPGKIVSGEPVIPIPDKTPPTTPSNLRFVDVSQTSAGLIWNASTDNIAVKGYYVTRNNKIIATVPASVGTTVSYLDSALNPGTKYGYSVIAFDEATNYSPENPLVYVTTASPPPPPGPPVLDNTVTIYYKKGYTTPYIHFRTLNGNWTTAPGIRMYDADIPGYAQIIINTYFIQFNKVHMQFLEAIRGRRNYRLSNSP
jgi:chitodextrinase